MHKSNTKKISTNDLNTEQKEALQKMLDGENIFLTGEAGTGKSYVLRKFINIMKQANKKVLMTAPTGKAAINISGVTLHKAFHIPVKFGDFSLGPNYCSKYIEEVDVLVIDEISMCRVDIFDYVMKYLDEANDLRKEKRKKDIQIILTGDFYQLPPVIRKSERERIADLYNVDDEELGQGFAFQSIYWEQKNIQTITLHQIVRQKDIKFKKNLSMARTGNSDCIPYFNAYSSQKEIPNAVFLSGTKRKVEKINQERLNELEGHEYVFYGSEKGDISDTPAPKELHLKVGCRVILLKNDADNQYVNGDMGYIQNIDMDNLEIEIVLDNGKIICVTPSTWKNTFPVTYAERTDDGDLVYKIKDKIIGTYTQFPIHLGYAITIHKSQGMTYDKVNLEPFCFTEGQLYVALSRCRTIDNLHLEYNIYPKYLKSHNIVNTFYEDSQQIKHLEYPRFKNFV